MPIADSCQHVFNRDWVSRGTGPAFNESEEWMLASGLGNGSAQHELNRSALRFGSWQGAADIEPAVP